MRTIRLRELPEWPPQPGGAFDSSWRFPTAGEAVVDELYPVQNQMVTFRGAFEGHPHSYHYKAATDNLASRIQTVIAANRGKTVAQLGDCEIEVED
jgi:hypothetical protein